MALLSHAGRLSCLITLQAYCEIYGSHSGVSEYSDPLGYAVSLGQCLEMYHHNIRSHYLPSELLSYPRPESSVIYVRFACSVIRLGEMRVVTSGS